MQPAKCPCWCPRRGDPRRRRARRAQGQEHPALGRGAHALPAEARLADHLFAQAEPGRDGDFLADLNPRSLEITGRLPPRARARCRHLGEAVQFERQGYFCRDPDSTPERPIFNRTVALRDTWARIQTRSS